MINFLVCMVSVGLFAPKQFAAFGNTQAIVLAVMTDQNFLIALVTEIRREDV